MSSNDDRKYKTVGLPASQAPEYPGEPLMQAQDFAAAEDNSQEPPVQTGARWPFSPPWP